MFHEELRFGEAICTCGLKSRLDVANASGKAPEQPSGKKTREYAKAADKVQDLLG